MKVLFLFVSAFLMVAKGKTATSKDDERFKKVQSEVVAGYGVDAGKEADGEGLQAVFAEEALVGAGPEQRAFAVGDSATETNLFGGVCVSSCQCTCV